MTRVTDQEWIQQIRAALVKKQDDPSGGGNPAFPVFYTTEAWKRQLADPSYQWQDGDLDRGRTIDLFEDMLVEIPAELRV